MSALFLKIVNLSITASWLILVIILIRPIMKKVPKWIQCALWVLVAVRLVCPFSIESMFSLIPSSEPIPQSIEMERLPAQITNPVVGKNLTTVVSASVNPMQILITGLSYLWVLGIIVMLGYAIFSYFRLKRVTRVFIEMGDNIRACDEVKSPFILGVLRPIIYLPSSYEGETLDYVLLHEKAHLRRHDNLWKPLGYVILAIYWFNPLCWAAYILLCRDIEMACDEKVVCELDKEGKAAYSQALLNCSFTQKRIVVSPLGFGEVGVKQRVKSILNYKKPTFAIILFGIVMVIIVAVLFLTNPNSEKDIKQTSETDSLVEGTEAENMIEENVAHAIEFKPSDIQSLSEAAVVLENGDIYKIDNQDILKKLEAMFLGAKEIKGVGCPISIPLYLYREDGSAGLIYPAMDGCNNFYADGSYYAFETEDGMSFWNMIELKVHNGQIQKEEVTNVSKEDLYDEMVRVINTVGLDNAYSWSNTVDFDQDAIIELAADDSGRYQIYGIVSRKYGNCGMLLNDRIGYRDNWNFEYLPWYYSGAASDEPTLESDTDGNFVFTYVYKYEDGAPVWKEMTLDCGYDTGHMELIERSLT